MNHFCSGRIKYSCQNVLPENRKARYCYSCQARYDAERGPYYVGSGRVHQIEERLRVKQFNTLDAVLNTPIQKDWSIGATRRTLALKHNMSEAEIETYVRATHPLRKHELLVRGKHLGHFDIETSQLNASFGYLISWALKEDGENGEIFFDALNKKDFEDAGYEDPDHRIVKSMVEALKKFDIITFHFGEYFDGPFARSRALLYNLDFPEYGTLAKIDTWRWCKRNLKLHSNRLDAVAEFFGINSKTHLKPAIWRRASRGDTSAIDYIVEHNKQDVVTLEKLYHRLKAYSAGTRSSI